MFKVLKRIVQAGLGQVGYQLVRSPRGPVGPPSAALPPDPIIGHAVCLRELARRGYQPTAVMDIGASSGSWTSQALAFWPAARYLLVEPLIEHQAQLSELSAKFPSVSFVVAVAGPEPGTGLLGIQADLDGSSLLYGGREQRAVPMITVDRLVEVGQVPTPQVLKLDVQGYEMEVLAGAANTLRTCDLVLLELQFFRFAPGMRLAHEAIQWMAERGFRPYEIVDVLRRPMDNAMGQCDVLFAREGHWLVSSNRWA
jgi:FkbM family methyltransferase